MGDPNIGGKDTRPTDVVEQEKRRSVEHACHVCKLARSTMEDLCSGIGSKKADVAHSNLELELSRVRSECEILRKDRDCYGAAFLSACAEIAELINRSNDDKRDGLNLRRLTSVDVVSRFLAWTEKE